MAKGSVKKPAKKSSYKKSVGVHSTTNQGLKKHVSRTTGLGTRFRPGGELKYFDHALGNTVLSDAGTIDDSLNLVPQGNGASQRVGRKFTIRKVHMRGTCRTVDDLALQTQGKAVIRLMLVWDKQANGAPATPGDVLQDAGGSTRWDTYRNLENVNRFKVLKEKVWDLNNLQREAAGTIGVARAFSWDVRCNIPVEMGQGNAITDVRSNNVFVLALTDNNPVAALQYSTRIRYTDD